MTRTLKLLAFAILLTACGAGDEDSSVAVDDIGEIQQALTGTSTRSGMGPTITQKGVDYTLTLPSKGEPGTTTWLQWVWNTNPATVPGLTVKLCRNTNATCEDVTFAHAASIWGPGHPLLGVAANQSFRFVFRISGSGPVSPVVTGTTDSVTQGYTY